LWFNTGYGNWKRKRGNNWHLIMKIKENSIKGRKRDKIFDAREIRGKMKKNVEKGDQW